MVKHLLTGPTKPKCMRNNQYRDRIIINNYICYNCAEKGPIPLIQGKRVRTRSSALRHRRQLASVCRTLSAVAGKGKASKDAATSPGSHRTHVCHSPIGVVILCSCRTADEASGYLVGRAWGAAILAMIVATLLHHRGHWTFGNPQTPDSTNVVFRN